ncbi:MAG: DEAD/DEAH box helicase family protein [Chloroflexi bacterium]|nr:DEAD/DEAH box helicase family protein [Chloroflexota bacterium]
MKSTQLDLEFPGSPKAGDVLKRIREESRDESEKGRWFEQLFMRIAEQQRDFEIDQIWRWPDWPEREELTGLDGRDIGIDLVARRTSGERIAIQCKCYPDDQTIGKAEIDKFLGGSQQEIFRLRWIVATCRWGPNAERAILNAHPPVSQIDFHQYRGVEIDEQGAKRPVQQPWPLQAEAIEDVVTGLSNHDRGRLVMACGTGKTFTSLRIAEQVVNDGGRILFTAPTIALVSQARREWLRHTTRELQCIVVCSDSTAGGRLENEDIKISELECPVIAQPEEIASSLDGETEIEKTCVVFCTYQSLGKVTEAQASHGLPEFDLGIADEAHRTTGAIRNDRNSNGGPRVDFQRFHDDQRLHARKRLYMTATPRIYTEGSKRNLAERGINVIDMGNFQNYGPELHRLPFSKAVAHKMLSDYRVIVLGVSGSQVTPSLRRRLESLNTATTGRNAPTINDMTRVLGVSLALNGVTEGTDLERPAKLPRTMAFANSIARSTWYAKALVDPQVLRATTKRMESGRAMKVTARHLDASASALQRNRELRELAQAGSKNECRVICNVKLFTEGVDVPQLDSVAFLDPRDSQVDVVQSVGRVMRKAPGKRFGYIIVPVVVQPGQDVIAALEQGTEGYHAVGRVLRALQAHDGRLAESPATFVKVYEQTKTTPPGGSGSMDDDYVLGKLDLKEAEQGIFARVAAASGLGNPGQLVADEIADAVWNSSAVLQEEGLEDELANALELVPTDDGGAKGICTIAALMLCNACLLQRRLRDEPGMETIMRLDKVAGAINPRQILKIAWESILEKDYAPVFRPALAVLAALPDGEAVYGSIRSLTECANRVADSLSELGYDHSGPLYHRILGSAKSDGAFYTNNLSAVMLASLALDNEFIDWADQEAVRRLRIMDPSCGTGTLLMAALQTIKQRVASRQDGELDDATSNDLHRRVVEDVLCGLDINQHGVQLAACNMTLGAPTVDYGRMNLVTMPHGPQGDGTVRAGSLEILVAPEETQDLLSLSVAHRSLEKLDANQVNESKEIGFPLRGLDLVMMNAPFTANENRSRKYGETGRAAMQRHELEIQRQVQFRGTMAAGVVTSNSIRTFFTPLADLLLNDDQGTLAMVIPTTACTGTSGTAERRFLATKFHVETVVTSHDPRRPNFSENTSIHESLLICRRRASRNSQRTTRFVALRSMPSTRNDAIECVEAIQAGDTSKWIEIYEQPGELVRAGDWRPCQFLDPELVRAAMRLERLEGLIKLGDRYQLGPAGQRIRDAFRPVSEAESVNGERVFWGRARDLRTSMQASPEQCVTEKKPKLAARYREQAGNLLLAAKFRTDSGRLLSIMSEVPALGSMWVPVQARYVPLDEAKALCAWHNSTLGALGFLMRRSTLLTNPSFSQAELATLLVPDFKSKGAAVLVRAFESTKLETVHPWKFNDNEVRECLDQAAAKTTGIDIQEIRDWRLRISHEPTICSQSAAASASEVPDD